MFLNTVLDVGTVWAFPKLGLCGLGERLNSPCETECVQNVYKMYINKHNNTIFLHGLTFAYIYQVMLRCKIFY